MQHLYDNAVVEDLQRDFITADGKLSVAVRMVDENQMMGVIAQIQSDEVEFPYVILSRVGGDTIDQNLKNFTMMHRGVPAVFEPTKNEFYHEKWIPIELGYDITVVGTNTAQIDEVLRELQFKYINMFYLTIRLPYESDRKIRFGIISTGDPPERGRMASGHMEDGHLYIATLPTECIGAGIVDYRKVKLKRLEGQINLVDPTTHHTAVHTSED